MPMLPTNPDALRADLQDQARADIAAYEAAAAADEAAREPEVFDPVDIVRAMHGEPNKADANTQAIAAAIRQIT